MKVIEIKEIVVSKRSQVYQPTFIPAHGQEGGVYVEGTLEAGEVECS